MMNNLEGFSYAMFMLTYNPLSYLYHFPCQSNQFLVDFSTMTAATDNFSDANKLGQGGFGAIYKVVMKHDYMEKNNIILDGEI